MRTRVILLLAIVLLAAAMPAAASTFNFSYMFATGEIVNGSFIGTRNDNGTVANLLDDFVTNPTMGSVFYQGTAMAGPVYANAYGNGWIGGPTSIYFNGTLNNFILTVCPGPVVCSVSNWEYFMMRTISQGNVGVEYYLQSPYTVTDDVTISAARWSLTEIQTTPTASAVPEPATLSLLGLGLAGVAAVVRRRRR